MRMFVLSAVMSVGLLFTCGCEKTKQVFNDSVEFSKRVGQGAVDAGKTFANKVAGKEDETGRGSGTGSALPGSTVMSKAMNDKEMKTLVTEVVVEASKPFVKEILAVTEGPDGRMIPLDVVGEGTVAMGDLSHLKVNKGYAQLSFTKEGLNGAQVVCKDIAPDYLRHQVRADWCWAACIQSIELFRNRGAAVTQEAIAARVFPNNEKVQFADSYTILKALQPKLAGQVDEFTYVATQAGMMNVSEGDIGEMLFYLKMSDYLDFYMGTQEVVESLMVGEPVIAGLLEKDKAPPGHDVGHIYLLIGAEFVEIDPANSTENSMRKLHNILKTEIVKNYLGGPKVQRSGAKEKGVLNELFGDEVAERAAVMGEVMKSLSKNKRAHYYALSKVYLFDPWPKKGEKKDVRNNLISMSGEDFRERLQFLVNRNHARDAFNIARQKQVSPGRLN